jgi:lipopolysaccharide/colanic/teichoic acid biosynthesis glycosyltransferase/RimJ/RimL family protein N-acetyltransferase
MSTSVADNQYVFYRSPETGNGPRASLDKDLRWEVWKPSLRSLWPKGMKTGRLLWFARWLMHYLHVFATREYSMFLIRNGERIVHRSVITPKYFGRPSMNKEDLGIGCVWTEPEYRGRGLGTYAIQEIIRLMSKPGRFFWYITRKGNFSSIAAAEHAGLLRVGIGTRTRRLGLRILGAFVMHPHSRQRHKYAEKTAVKRALDVLCSLFGLLLLSPLLVIVALMTKRGDGGPVFYRGLRVGRWGRPFRIFKFRTMVLNADKIGGPSASDDDPRITRVGRFLRKYKLDELPQLINVLKGEMSIVGPRPEVQQYADMYTEEERVILSVRPGITDWASLWNPDEGAILAGSRDPEKTYLEEIRPQKIRLQLEYIRRHSLWVDIEIMLRTLAVILLRSKPPAAQALGEKGRG